MIKDVKYTSPRNKGREMFYIPFSQANTGRGQMTLVVRTASDPLTVAAAVRRETQAMDPQMPSLKSRPWRHKSPLRSARSAF